MSVRPSAFLSANLTRVAESEAFNALFSGIKGLLRSAGRLFHPVGTRLHGKAVDIRWFLRFARQRITRRFEAMALRAA